MSPQNNHLQRPPAAVLYADELAKLKQNDNAPCPPGWQLSLPAARAFILGDEAQNISRKVVISPSAVERMLVTLATGRGFDVGGGNRVPQNLFFLNYWQPLLAAMPG
ncbi:ATPase [Escherichia coli]|nr:ATPase [Escherichia coli]